VLLVPSLAYADDIAATVVQLDLKRHVVGYLAVAITVMAYSIAMTEDLHQMSKAKPMVLGSALIWFAIFMYYSSEYGTAKHVAVVFQSNS
jgi:heme/copper-type cytochrome/quinol oxidase subunit 4